MTRLFSGGQGRLRETPAEREADRAAAVKALGPRGIVSRMAETMLDEVTRNGQATSANLIVAGFSAGDIARYGAAAQAQLRRLAPDLRGAELGEHASNDVGNRKSASMSATAAEIERLLAHPAVKGRIPTRFKVRA